MFHRQIKLSVIAVLALSACAAANSQSFQNSIQLPSMPSGVAVNPVTNRIYVALPSFGGPTDSLGVIDGKTDTLIKTITIPPVGYQVAVDFVRSKVYVGGCSLDASGNTQCAVVVVKQDEDHETKIKTIPIPTANPQGLGILGLAVDPRRGTVYVSNASDNVIDVISWEEDDDDQGGPQIHQIPVSEPPVGLAVNPFARRLYVALVDQVAVIDTKTNTVLTSSSVGSGGDIGVNWVTGNVFVPNPTNPPASTAAILQGDGTLLATVNVGNLPYGVDVDPFTNLAFIANTHDATVSVIDGSTNTVLAPVGLPVNGLFVALNPATAKGYVTSETDNSISVVSEK